MNYGWRGVTVLLAKIFLYRLVILYSFIGTRGITGYILFGVAQREKISNMVKLVFIFIWVLGRLCVCMDGEEVCWYRYMYFWVKLLAMKQYIAVGLKNIAFRSDAA